MFSHFERRELFEIHLETQFNYQYHLDVLLLTKKLRDQPISYVGGPERKYRIKRSVCFLGKEAR